MDSMARTLVRAVARSASALSMVAALLIFTGCSEAPAPPAPKLGENCDLILPPDDSGEVFTHGAVLFVYPRALSFSPSYSGCRTTWVSDGLHWAVTSKVVIENGKPIQAIFMDEKSERFNCRYDDMVVVEGDPSICFKAEHLINRSAPAGCYAAYLNGDQEEALRSMISPRCLEYL